MSSPRPNYWSTCCGEVPREQIVFLIQVIIAYIVIITSLLNISITTENTCLWATLISGTLGYLLPAPSIRHEQPFLRGTPV
jgi:hypothetical protein